MRLQVAALAFGATRIIVLLVAVGCSSTMHAPLATEINAAESVHGSQLDAFAACGRPRWEGRYVWSNGFEAYEFRISEGRFRYEFSHCTGIGEFAHGAAEHVGEGRLVLAAEAHQSRRAPRGSGTDRRRVFRFESEMYAVPWCDETFLVPASLMREFCALVTAHGPQAVKRGDYPRRIHSEGDGGHLRPALSGLPDVPAEFALYLQ
jgi:hypothetical protein